MKAGYWRRGFLVAGLLLSLVDSGAPTYGAELDSQMNHFFEQKASAKFDLVSHFPTGSETMLVLPELVKPGVWQEDRFAFPGAESSTDIILDQIMLAGELTEVIRCQPSPDNIKRIHFPQILSGSKVLVYTLVSPIESEGSEQSGAGAVYLKIFAGAKLLTRTRLTAGDGWSQANLVLGSSRFLRKNLNLTLEISSDGSQNIVTVAGFII